MESSGGHTNCHVVFFFPNITLILYHYVAGNDKKGCMAEGQTFTIGKCIVNLYLESEVIIVTFSMLHGFTFYYVVHLKHLELLISGWPAQSLCNSLN